MTGRRATLPLYLGGFLGPFGGAVLAVLIPELRDAFHATTDQVALAVPRAPALYGEYVAQASAFVAERTI